MFAHLVAMRNWNWNGPLDLRLRSGEVGLEVIPSVSIGALVIFYDGTFKRRCGCCWLVELLREGHHWCGKICMQLYACNLSNT